MTKITNPVNLHGEIVDRSQIAFRLAEDPKNKNVLYDHKGTKYIRNEKGVLHRYPPKGRRCKD